jgi:hypothetical protein
MGNNWFFAAFIKKSPAKMILIKTSSYDIDDLPGYTPPKNLR